MATWWKEEERVEGSAYIDTISKNFSSHDLYVKINGKKIDEYIISFNI